MSTNLFGEFEEVTAKQWKQKIQYDLKGADYNEKLIWKSGDGVDIRPFYHPDETPDPVSVKAASGWSICEKIYVASAEVSNRKAKEAVERGAESLWFLIPSEEISSTILFKDLTPEVPVYVSFEFISESYVKKLSDILKNRDGDYFLQIDIIGNLARTGNWYSGLKEDHEQLDSILENSKGFRSVLSIDTGLYQNAGANIPQQLAYGLAHANEYLNHITSHKTISGEAGKESKPQFITATGPNYFFEIAKLRALRLLYASLATAYSLPEECHILSRPSKRNKTLYDYNVNMLRTTTESMSAVLGGADVVNNMPYDALFHKNNEFGNRIARNQLLILKKESYFAKVSNPAEGSYYLETLTRQFAEKALEIFKDIEKAGGFLKQLKDGTIQKKIAKSAAEEQELFDSGGMTLVGTNKFPNWEDKMKEELELYPFLKKKPRKTLIPPILEKRLAEKTEQERLKEE